MKTGVVIVNYNCAPYALDAALSAIGDDPEANVVIVDNASTDHSMRYFRDVLSEKCSHTSQAPVTDLPLPVFASISGLSHEIQLLADESVSAQVQLTILDVEDNNGFAAGCNIGIRFLQAAFDPDIFLLLNPDAILASGSICAFRDRLADPVVGLCGASILRFENPACAQAFGGARMNPMTLLGDNIGAGRSLDSAPDIERVENAMSYPLGAAMAFRKDYLEVAGYLDERFFLYYEEADWTRRGLPSRQPVWAREAIIYHRHGATAGSRQPNGERSALSDYHMARSRMLYALKWRPALWPFLFALSLGQSARRFLRGHPRQARAVLAGVIPGMRSPKSLISSVSG
jgi:GT2 family glycosyltransferase